MIVKVCGMRDADNIRAVEQLPIDWMGFIFYPHSKRYVTTADYLPERCRRIGVFVDATPEEILEAVERYDLKGIQLHGSESPEFCATLRRALWPDPGMILLKAFNIGSKADVEATRRYEGLCDYYLFDTPGPSHGGTGRSFDWSLLEAYTGNTPFLLSGGLGPESITKLRTLRHPRWCGVDLNSKFELEPALKNVAVLQEFLGEFRKLDNK
jgi:phosphoribosylanthranilate isomerase